MAEMTPFEKLTLKLEKDKKDELAKQKIRDTKQLASEQKTLDDIEKKTAEGNELSKQQLDQLKSTKAFIKSEQADRKKKKKSDEEASQTVKAGLDQDKEVLATMAKSLTDRGIKAESDAEYNKENLRIQNKEFEIQKAGASDRKALLEIEREQKKVNDDAKKTGSFLEDKKERAKDLASAFSKSTIGKGILGIGKSIGGFIGGLTSGARGGAELFLKGIITASALGLIITFLKSDLFKSFLSEENLIKISDFFKNLKDYFFDLYNMIADPENKSSLMFALKAAGIIATVGLIVAGFKMLGGTFSGIAALFGAKSALSEATEVATKQSKGTVGKKSKFLKFLKAGAFIGLAIGAFEGITAAQDSYNKGESGQKVFGSFVGGLLESLSFGILSADNIKEFISPDKQKKILESKEKIKKLEESDEEFVEKKLPGGRIVLQNRAELIAKEKKSLAKLEIAAKKEKSDQEEFLKEKTEDEKFAKERRIFLRKEQEKLGVKFSDSGQIIGGRGYNIRKKEEEIMKKFDMANSPKFKREAIEEKKKQDLRTIKLENDNFDKIKMKELNELKNPQLQKGSRLAKQTLIGLNDFGGSGMTINNNIVNSNQNDNSQTVNKNNGGKSVTPNVAQQLILSST